LFPVLNYKNKLLYYISTEANVSDVFVDVLNEPEVFHQAFTGSDFTTITEKEALLYLKEWKEEEIKGCLNYYILYNNHIIAHIIIDHKGEIGYWCSSKHSGLMTNALSLILRLNKKNYFFCKIHQNNQKSINLALRSGFSLKELVGHFYFFEKFL
jgi:RimJ/RimL family protein N-acetyltransferase